MCAGLFFWKIFGLGQLTLALSWIFPGSRYRAFLNLNVVTDSITNSGRWFFRIDIPCWLPLQERQGFPGLFQIGVFKVRNLIINVISPVGG
jgi:hypothetical protein